MTDSSKRFVGPVVAILGAVALFVVFTLPDSHDRAAKSVWEEYSSSEQANQCDAYEANPELFGEGQSADAIRDLLKDEC